MIMTKCASCGQELPERTFRMGDKFRISVDLDPKSTYILASVGDGVEYQLINIASGLHWGGAHRVTLPIMESKFEAIFVHAGNTWEYVEKDEDA